MVGVAEPTVHKALAGGLRDRLKIKLQDGSTELFVINKLDKVVEQIRETSNTP